MSLMIIAIMGIIAIAALMIVPRLSAGLGGVFSQTGGGTGGSSTRVSQTDGNTDIDVSGNGCACANGVCKGNCSDMEQIDLANFDPLDWVSQRT
jgi:hypothetical protein